MTFRRVFPCLFVLKPWNQCTKSVRVGCIGTTEPKLDYSDVVFCHWRKGGDNFQIKVHHNVLCKILQVYGNQDTYPAQAYNITKTMICDIEHVEQQEYEKINRQKEEYNETLEKFFCGQNPVTQTPHKRALKKTADCKQKLHDLVKCIVEGKD